MTPLAGRLDGATLASYSGLLGGAALLVSRPAQARDLYEKALGVCQNVRFRPELALIHLDMAALLLDHYPSENTQASDHLQTAIGEFEEMHMQPSLDRALELYRTRVPDQSPKSVRRVTRPLPDSSEALTDREPEVASCLAQGISNREIATELVISESTPEVHVKHILSKLGLRSRSQVAAWAAGHDLPI